LIDEVSEQELIRRAKAKDKLAYEELLRPNLKPAAQLARVLLGHPTEAEDAVQEAAIQAWRRIGNLHDGAVFRPWFFGIVVRQVRNIQRGRWWSLIRLPSLRTVTSPPIGPWLEGEDLRRAVGKLPRAEREAIAMHFYLDMRIEDVATSLNLSVAAIKSRVNRALRKLRASLREDA
jgi:RNA polymerase sigma-70 factor (ECF subfamily)